MNCRDLYSIITCVTDSIMSVFYAGIILTLVTYVASHTTTPVPGPSTTLFQPLSKACKVGDLAVNECNKCICTPDFFFKCVSKPCNTTVVQGPKNKTSCEPDKLYIKDLIGCLCKSDGSWPHETCRTLFDSFQVKSKDTCKPNAFVIVDCNVCKCGSNGKINKNRCTKNKCETDLAKKSRRYIKQNQVYGSCVSQNWYSLAPCQFCFCISGNKLVCNTGHSYAKQLQLGSYNLSICGKDFITDAMNLIPEADKSLRVELKSNANEADFIEKTTESHRVMEINREANERPTEQKMEIKQLTHKQERNENDSDDSDSVEIKPQMPIGRQGSTKLPYEEDENNPSSDSENENQNANDIETDIESPKLNYVITDKKDIRSKRQPNAQENFPQHFEWISPVSENGQNLETLSLGDVLKPYLPVVLDKVFQMALRKSMVSIEADANCTPGATTMLNCNACFCLKNNKMLCTKNKCD